MPASSVDPPGGVRPVRAVLLDSGDTLVDEGTEVRAPGAETVLRADLVPGAAELVHALVRRGYPLGLVADGPVATFRNVLGAHGLLECFDAVAISEAVGIEKPAPAMFRAALAALGVSEDEYPAVVMVGNNLRRDIGGANALGLISVWIDWSPRRRKTPRHRGEVPRHRINAPLDLLDLLDRLAAGAL